MPLLKLERAVFFPSQLVNRTDESYDTPLMPYSCHVTTNPLEADEIKSKSLEVSQFQKDGDINECILVPGGRFLFTMSDKYKDGMVCTKLWDLGRPGTGRSRITLLSRLAGWDRIRATSSTTNGLGIRVITTSDNYVIKVYQIFPLSPKPAFEEVARIRISEYIRSINISGNRIICSTSAVPVRNMGFNFVPPPHYEPGFIFIWDFVQNTSSVLRPVVALPREFYLLGNHIITFHDNSLSMWSIPPLKSDVPEFKSRMLASIPIRTSALSRWSEGERPQVKNDLLRPQTGWIPEDPSPLCLVAESVCNIIKTIQYAMYRFDSSWLTKTSNLPADAGVDDNKLPAPLHVAEIDQQNEFGQEYYIWPCPTLVQTSYEDVFLTVACNGQIIMAMMPMAEKENAEELWRPQLCCLSVGRLESFDCEQFCVATGRGVLGGNDKEARVFDYM